MIKRPVLLLNTYVGLTDNPYQTMDHIFIGKTYIVGYRVARSSIKYFYITINDWFYAYPFDLILESSI